MAAPFDAMAAEYDARFTETRLGRVLRRAVWDIAGRTFQPGMRLLEIGCGTGEDAVWLAGQGMQVVATDASAAMVSTTLEKAGRHTLADRVEAHHCRAENLPLLGPAGPFDGALSNFGVLNCVEHLPPLARWLGEQIRPGGALLIVVMGRWCPWDLAWYLAHGQPRSALRRWRKDGVEARIGASTVRIHYPSPQRLARTFAPEFRLRYLSALGLLLPISEAAGLVDRLPNSVGGRDPVRLLADWERAIAARRPFRSLGDHTILLFERCGPRAA
jgi:ubiquinone/menaquinone biosynthesis C-methylase UbiE